MKYLSALIAIALVPACVHNDPHARNVVHTKLRNEDGKLVVIFRNVGRQVVSFDYTIADKPTVPHVDSEGKNSGLVANLYPGEERPMQDYPMQKSIIWPKIGTLTYGRRSMDQLEKMYRPLSAQKPGALDPAGASLLIPGAPSF
jgi:hypothetical protein